MTNLLDDCAFISAQTSHDLVLFKNPVDDDIKVFVFLEINHKTSNTPYHELIGKDITKELMLLNQQAFDSNVFEQKLDKLMTLNLRCPDNNWIWLKATKPV